MPVNISQYKETIKQASKNARNATSIDEALDIQAAGYADALATAISQMQTSTTVVGGSSSGLHTGTVS